MSSIQFWSDTAVHTPNDMDKKYADAILIGHMLT